MPFIPGLLVSILTFPGVIVHEFAHRFFADLAKVPVYQVRYFRFGNPAGYVLHGPVHSLKSAFLISVGPLLVNTLLCAAMTFFVFFPLIVLGMRKADPAFMILAWVGISIGMHAFPSNEDMAELLACVKLSGDAGPLLWAATFFSWFFKLANLLRVLWFDLIYALLVACALPLALGFL